MKQSLCWWVQVIQRKPHGNFKNASLLNYGGIIQNSKTGFNHIVVFPYILFLQFTWCVISIKEIKK